ncbi:MAG: hypothetical protein KC944_20105 [Candidatus Omnitrophica bacterium]|nr:hypothetical protein [Candidatus Omnitrophota bacterium]
MNLKFIQMVIAIMVLSTVSPSLCASSKGEEAVGEPPVSAVWEDLACFALSNPPRIERYDLAQQTWLDAIPIQEDAIDLWVDAEGIFVGYLRSVSRIPLDSTEEQHLRDTAEDLNELVATSDYLFILWGEDNITSCMKTTGAYIDSKEYFDSMHGLSIASSLGRIFARDPDGNEVLAVEFEFDGKLGLRQQDTPTSSPRFPNAERTYLFPNDRRLVDDSGSVFDPRSLLYQNTLPISFEEIVFYGDLPIIATGGVLYSFSNSLNQTGQYAPEHSPLKISLKDQSVFSFYAGGDREIDVEIISLDFLTPELPGQSVDPMGLRFHPRESWLDSDSTIYLSDPANLSVHLWSLSERHFLESVSLSGSPTFVAYSGDTHRLYTAYGMHEIAQVKLEEGLDEQPFVMTQEEIAGLATAGEFVFVAQVRDGRDHATYSPNGELIDLRDFGELSPEYVWDSINRKLFYIWNLHPRDIVGQGISTEGIIGVERNSPFHDSEGYIQPVRVSPTGDAVIVGGGRVHDPETLDEIGYLPNPISDVVWDKENLIAIRETDVSTQVQKIGPDYTILDSIEVDGDPHRIFSASEELVVITVVDDLPVFHILNSDLEILETSDHPTRTPTATASPTPTITPSHTATLTFAPEDVDEDHDVDETDLLMVIRKWHTVNP